MNIISIAYQAQLLQSERDSAVSLALLHNEQAKIANTLSEKKKQEKRAKKCTDKAVALTEKVEPLLKQIKLIEQGQGIFV